MTLSKLKEEGRMEFDMKFENVLIDYDKGKFVNDYNTVDIKTFLTDQIQKAYLTALSDVEKGLPKKKTINKLKFGTDGSRYPFGYNSALSAVKEVISKLKESK